MDGFDTERLSVQVCDPGMAPHEHDALVSELPELLTQRVLEHLPPSVQKTGQGTEAWLAARLAASKVFAIRRKGTQRLLGLLFLFDAPDGLNLGYMLTEASWGKGISSEVVQGCLEALQGLKRQRPFAVFAGVDRENPASARVLEKAGFQKMSDSDGMAHYETRIG